MTEEIQVPAASQATKNLETFALACGFAGRLLPALGHALQDMNVHLNHFQAMLFFALVISVAFGFVSRRRPLDRVKYMLWSLFLFLLVGIGIGWAMYPFSR